MMRSKLIPATLKQRRIFFTPFSSFFFFYQHIIVLNLGNSNIYTLSKVETSIFEKYIPYTQNQKNPCFSVVALQTSVLFLWMSWYSIQSHHRALPAVRSLDGFLALVPQQLSVREGCRIFQRSEMQNGFFFFFLSSAYKERRLYNTVCFYSRWG